MTTIKEDLTELYDNNLEFRRFVNAAADEEGVDDPTDMLDHLDIYEESLKYTKFTRKRNR